MVDREEERGVVSRRPVSREEEAFDGCSGRSVDSLLFCQTSERGPRPVPPREGERNEGTEARKGGLFSTVLASPFSI